MAAIPRRYIVSLNNLLHGVSDDARAKLEKALLQVDVSDIASARNEIVAIMDAILGPYTDNVAAITSIFYDDLRAWAGIQDGFKAEAESGRDSAATEGAVRAFMQDVVDGKPYSGVVDRCLDRADYELKRAANECMAHNAGRDPRKPKWARVPTGLETCEWCIMLASRGFAYGSEEAASHTHPGCDCRVVPSWDRKNPAVEGYDPGYYLDCYKHPEDHPEIREAINARRRERYAQSSSARRIETKVKRSVPDASALETAEGKAVRDSEKLQRSFKPETAARLGIAVEDSAVSGDAVRANAAKVFASAVEDDARYARLSIGVDKAQYNPATKQIEIQADFDADPRTVVHETFHLRDFQQSIPYGRYGWMTTGSAYSSMRFVDSLGGYLKDRIADDWGAIEAHAASEGKTTEEYLRGRIEAAGLNRRSYDETGFVSDLIDAASNGAVRFSGGHTYTDPDYWNHAGAVQTEFLADYGGSAVCNPVEYELMRELFPTSCGTMDEIIEAMANA